MKFYDFGEFAISLDDIKRIERHGRCVTIFTATMRNPENIFYEDDEACNEAYRQILELCNHG